MKSYIVQLADYREAPISHTIEIHCPEDYLQAELSFLILGQKDKTEPDDSDVVSFAASQPDLAEIKTVEAYRNYLREGYLREQRKGAIDEAVKSILSYVVEHSEWYFDEKELAQRTRNAIRRTNEALIPEEEEEEALAEGKPLQITGLEEMSDEEFALIYGDVTREELLEEYREASRLEMAYALWSAKEQGLLMNIVNMKTLAGQIFEIVRGYAASQIEFVVV